MGLGIDELGAIEELLGTEPVASSGGDAQALAGFRRRFSTKLVRRMQCL